MNSAVDIARRASDRATSAAATATAAANDMRAQLRDRQTALDAARAALVDAENVFDASPSEDTGQVVTDLRCAVDLCTFLVTRATARLDPLRSAATLADKAKNEALFQLRAAESLVEIPPPAKHYDRAALERGARAGDAWCQEQLSRQRGAVLINGDLPRPSHPIVTAAGNVGAVLDAAIAAMRGTP